MDAGGHLRSSTITRPVVAYACFAGLIDNEKDMQEVQCGFEYVIPFRIKAYVRILAN